VGRPSLLVVEGAGRLLLLYPAARSCTHGLLLLLLLVWSVRAAVHSQHGSIGMHLTAGAHTRSSNTRTCRASGATLGQQHHLLCST
jgi:hypothetical protein